MDSTLIGLMGIGIAIFFGLIGVAICLFFGLRTFREGIKGELSVIKEKIIIIQETVQNVWDVFKRTPILGATGTVERELSNLGKISITAEPHLDYTNYYIKAQKPVFDTGDIATLTKQTGLHETEKEMFGGQIPLLRSTLPDRLVIQVPSADPKLCTEYMSILLKWLDSTYIQAQPKIEDFEEPIQI